MNEDLNQVIEEKFSRCPKCRSFSVRQIEHLSLKDKLKSLFVPLTAHMCDNCAHRFVIIGSVSSGLRDFLRSLTRNFPRKCIAVSIPIVILAVLITILLISGENNKMMSTIKKVDSETISKRENHKRGEIPPDKKIKETRGTKEEGNDYISEKKNTDQLSDVNDNHKIGEAKIPAKELGGQQLDEKKIPDEPPDITSSKIVPTEIFLYRNRFGVNWRPVAKGVQITRLSKGPLKEAGLLVGDILIALDDQPVRGDGANVELARDEIFYGRRETAIIKVLRNEEILLFKLIKGK